jgi:transcriptional regulator with XRE-family HTH domain
MPEYYGLAGLLSIVQYSGNMTSRPRSLLFTPHGRRHSVNLVVIEGGAAFRERLGVVLRELRRNTVGERGKPLTQQEAAEAVGTDTDTIGRWERGQNLPTVDVLERIAQAYQVPREKWWILLDPPALPERVSPLHELLAGAPLAPHEIDQLGDAAAAGDQDVHGAGASPVPSPGGEGTHERRVS